MPKNLWLTRNPAKAAEMGRKGGARTAQLRREGKIGGEDRPIADAKELAAKIMKWKDE